MFGSFQDCATFLHGLRCSGLFSTPGPCSLRGPYTFLAESTPGQSAHGRDRSCEGSISRCLSAQARWGLKSSPSPWTGFSRRTKVLSLKTQRLHAPPVGPLPPFQEAQTPWTGVARGARCLPPDGVSEFRSPVSHSSIHRQSHLLLLHRPDALEETGRPLQTQSRRARAWRSPCWARPDRLVVPVQGGDRHPSQLTKDRHSGHRPQTLTQGGQKCDENRPTTSKYK